MRSVFIGRKTIENSIKYLACPIDKSELKIDIPNKDFIDEGDYKCTECGNVYAINDGIPYFSMGKEFNWNGFQGKDDIITGIVETIENRELTTAKIAALGSLFLTRVDRKQAIDDIFYVTSKVCEETGADTESQAILLQAATKARYDIEVYRGTFTLPNSIFGSLKDYTGIVVEGACATGECLDDLSDRLSSDFYIGLDISGELIRTAQNGKENTLFVQGDICSMPFRENAVGLYVLNNVFDRAADPLQACREADTVCNSKSILVLSNCRPLQYDYFTADGERIEFVPRSKQLTLGEGIRIAGFQEIDWEKSSWQVDTVAYGPEEFKCMTIVGGRK